MKNLEISRNFGNGLEILVDKNSCSGSFGTVGSPMNSESRSVFMPYTNVQIGTVEKDYSGQEFFKANYECGQGIPLIRKY